MVTHTDDAALDTLTLAATTQRPTRKNVCGKCCYWQRTAEEAYGECHRHAPHPIADAISDAFWPDTFATDWCGEFA